MTRTSVLFLMLMSAGCASGPPPDDIAAWEYRRDIARVEAYENFMQLKRDCGLRGGAVLVSRSSSPRMPPSTTEMRLATCGFPH
jgi:hypothetical protein